MRWVPGQKAIDYLLAQGRLEQVADAEPSRGEVEALLSRAELRLRTAGAALQIGDYEGAYAAAYDVCRMAAECLLMQQGLRATSGQGSHMAVEDAVCAQFDGEIASFTKAIYGRLRSGRHDAQYFDPRAPEKTEHDARWAVETAGTVPAEARRVIESGKLGLYG